MGSIASSYSYGQDVREKFAKLPSSDELRNRHKSVLLNPHEYPLNVQSDAASFANHIVEISGSASPQYNTGIMFGERPKFEAIQIVELMKMIEQWPSEAFHVIGESCKNAPACGCSRYEYCSYRPACDPFWLDSWDPKLVKLESQL